jgi:hypothetical protein
MTNLAKPNQQLTKQSKSIGLIKSNFTDNKIKIYEAYRSLKRIRDFVTNDELKPLIDLVGKWRYYIGIREELSQEELFMNVTFIRENFSSLNLVDINQAINLSLKGDLNIDAEHYQNFTPLYIAKVLNAYQSYRGKVIYDIRNSIDKIENKPVEPTIKEKVAITISSLESMYSQREDKRFHDYGGVTYDFIKRNELMVFTKVLVAEAMEYGKKQNLDSKRKSAYKDAVQGTQKNLKTAREKKEETIRNSARNYVVQKWLLKYDEESFKQFLGKITDKMI